MFIVANVGLSAAQVDGERLPLPAKDLGSCDLYPQTLSHNPNGRFVTVCGDGEYIIYTALAWRNKSFGTAEEFVWGEDSSVYAIRCTSAGASCCPRCAASAMTLSMAHQMRLLSDGSLIHSVRVTRKSAGLTLRISSVSRLNS